jgi:dGTPase
LEGQVVRYSDKIAYVNHDIDDSIRAGLLKDEDLPKEVISILGKSHSNRIDTLVKDCIYSSIYNIDSNNIEISLSNEIGNSLALLRNFMFERIYKGSILKIERDKAKFVLEQVFNYYMKHPEKMPTFYKEISDNEGLCQGVADYISGMSDDYCLVLFRELYVPKFLVY